ncbi:MAG: NAD-binding protein [Aigarchaeota archaeon]|nr:NAD-binding protein [Candidatus Pelearchaeum maunauluense]
MNGRNPVVVVEDEERARMLSRSGVRVMYGDPADENILKEAGIGGCSSL